MNINQMLMRTILFLLLIVACLSLHNGVADVVQHILIGEEDVMVDVDTTEPLNHIEEYFISFTIDSQEFSEHFEKMNFRLIYFWAFVCCIS